MPGMGIGQSEERLLWAKVVQASPQLQVMVSGKIPNGAAALPPLQWRDGPRGRSAYLLIAQGAPFPWFCFYSCDIFLSLYADLL